MTENVINRLLYARVERDGKSLRLIRAFDTGCHKSTQSQASRQVVPCELRVVEAEIPGIWVHAIRQRFADGTEVSVHRQADHSDAEDTKDKWSIAQLRIGAAWRLSQSAMALLEDNRGAFGPGRTVFNAGIGKVEMIPQCQGRELKKISFFYLNHNVHIDISDYGAIALYSRILCRP